MSVLDFMTYDEFKRRVHEKAHVYLEVFPKDEVDAFLEENEHEIRESYDDIPWDIKMGFGAITVEATFNSKISEVAYGLRMMF